MSSIGLVPENFKQLPKDGARFESLVCQLLEAMGYRILEKPAVGTEGGRDVLVERTLKDEMVERREKVVVQCKHYAHSGKAIGDKDVGVWQNAMSRYKARGYLLVTDTRVTENLRRSFREFTEDEANYPKWATFWDVDELITHLNKHPEIRDSFLSIGTVKQTPLENLAAEVRIWLQTIRYDVSDPQQRDDRTMEMVAVLDQGTVKQRVLVRCIGGEIISADVDALDEVLDRKTPQGWLISDKRVSDRARTRADEDDAFQVFNLAEFLQKMVWKPYLKALTSLVEESQIPGLYVDLTCHKQEMDEQGHEIGRDRYDSLDAYIDTWLTERGKMHISLLGEFGTGKTWFCRHYAYRQWQCYLNDPANERLPLLITLRTFAKAMTAQQLINDALLEQYKLPFVGSAFQVFQEMNRRGKLLLILDGFDEMARQVDYQTVVDNFWELAKLVDENSKVILTSRTEYFRWAKESEKILGGEEFGRRTIVLSPPKFEVLYLEPFSEEQISEVITRRLGEEEGPGVAKRILETKNLAEMARKPILVELLLAALDEVSADVLENPAQVYLYATNRLLLRNIDTQRTFTTTADKLYFLCELAWEMIQSGELRIHYTDIPERIKTYFGDRIKDQHDLDTWDFDLRNQTLLHRDAAGYYEFAHKSLAEYFVAFKFASELGCLAQEFAQTYCEADDQPCQVPIEQKDIVELAETFGAMALMDEQIQTVRDLLPGVMAEDVTGRLWKVIDETIGKESEQVKYAGGNVATLLRMKGVSFANRKLARTILTGANLKGSDLTGVDLQGAYLRKANLSDSILEKADIREADLAKIIMQESVISALAWNPKCNFLVSAGTSGVIVWSTVTWDQVMILDRDIVSSLSWNADGRFLAGIIGSHRSHTVAIWDVEKNCKLSEIRNSPEIHAVQFAPKTSRFLSAHDNGTVALWNINGNLLHSWQVSNDDWIVGAFFSPSEDIFITADTCGVLQVWNGKTLELLQKLSIIDVKSGQFGNWASIDPRNENLLSVALYNNNLITLNIENGSILYELTGGYSDCCHSPVDMILATGYREQVLLLEAESGVVILSLEGHTAQVNIVRYSPDGRYLSSADEDNTLRIWDVAPNSPTFGQCLKVLEIKMNCKGMQISGAHGLERELRQRLEVELELEEGRREGTLLEFFTERGAILDEKQKQKLAELRKQREVETTKE